MKKLHKWLLFFGLRSTAIFLAFYLIFLFLNNFGLLFSLQLLDAKIVFEIMHFFHPKIFLDGIVLRNLVVSGSYIDFAVSIDLICSSYVPITLFSSLVLGLPLIEKGKRLHCLALGIPLLFAANILRLVAALFTAALFGFEAFDFVHLVLFKVDLGLFVILTLLFCLLLVIEKKELLNSVNKTV